MTVLFVLRSVGMKWCNISFRALEVNSFASHYVTFS
jgi:hypothetical protein